MDLPQLPTLTKGFCMDVPTWDELEANVEGSMQSGARFAKIPNLWTFTCDGQHIESVQRVLTLLDLKVAHVYLCDKSGNHGHGWHNDETDVWFWQCHGSTRWNFENNRHYILEPGDLLYIPRLAYHEVISLSKRAGLSMSKI